jgi:hypothetical protein
MAPLRKARCSLAEVLTLSQQQSLDQLEARIETGLTEFVKVGAALWEICEGRLYRGVGRERTFAGYCRERWDMTPRHAYRLIEAAVLVTELRPLGHILPSSERQSRALAKAGRERLPRLWSELSANDHQPTTAEIEEAVRRSGVAVPPPREALLGRVKSAEAEAAREAKRLGDRDRIAAGERALRKAVKFYEGLGGELGGAVVALLRQALAASVVIAA